MVLVTDRQLNVNCYIPLSLFFNGIVYIKKVEKGHSWSHFLNIGRTWCFIG